MMTGTFQKIGAWSCPNPAFDFGTQKRGNIGVVCICKSGMCLEYGWDHAVPARVQLLQLVSTGQIVGIVLEHDWINSQSYSRNLMLVLAGSGPSHNPGLADGH